ncbi:hypothetical protein BCD91_001792 [Clostridium beijerinckii]|uniref:hypothetical protein n=1 Tax=Clostridium beijerinckii TaxID=1520 RepID=UPI00149409E3|nr:hypothetical protein [Clostridium beijerinckii]NOW89769.1 hypothetical protein [Clostridium beijerinckii]
MDEIKLVSINSFLKCVRNELRPENRETTYGLEGLLQYKLDDIYRKGDPDSMYLKYNEKNNHYEGKSYANKLFKQIYGCVEDSSDTIFNCWSFFRMFKEARVGKSKMILDCNDSPVFDGKYGLEELFEGFPYIRELLNKFADLHHCLANMMPAPRGYNGYKNKYKEHDGKGNWERDNDMPDIYYQRAKYDFPDMFSWINKHIDDYCLSFFIEYESPWCDRTANKLLDLKNSEEVSKYKRSIENAISCIEKRAKCLYNLKNNRI